MNKGTLKVCINTQCEEVAHNCDKQETRCRNCNMLLCRIDKTTYMSKYINNCFQYDYSNDSGTIVTPMQMGYALQMELVLM